MGVVFDKLLGKPLLHSHTTELDTRYLKLTGGTLTPSADSISVFKVTKADGTTPILTVNSTNKFVAVDVIPTGGQIDANIPFYVLGSNNNYYGVNVINTSAGATASCDVVVANDVAQTFGNFVDLGINGHAWNDANFATFDAGAAYCYSITNNMYYGSGGTSSTTGNIYFFTGGRNSKNYIRASIGYQGGLTITGGNDVTQLLVKGNATQTATAQVDFQTSTGSSLWNMKGNGLIAHAPTSTTPTAVTNGHLVTFAVQPAGAAVTQQQIAMQFTSVLYGAGGGNNGVIGVQGNARNSQTADTIANIYGGSFNADNLNTGGNVTTLAASSHTVNNYSASQKVTYGMGVYVFSPGGSGLFYASYGIEIQNMGKANFNYSYGLNIENQSGSTTCYAIKTGTGAVSFGDNVTIASTKTLTISAASIITDTTTGLKIATGTTQKLGFYNATPVVQPSAYTQTYSTASKTLPNQTSADLSTTASTQTSPWGFATQAQADAIATQFNALRADLDATKKVLNQVIDDFQALGLLS